MSHDYNYFMRNNDRLYQKGIKYGIIIKGVYRDFPHSLLALQWVSR